MPGFLGPDDEDLKESADELTDGTTDLDGGDVDYETDEPEDPFLL